MAHAFKLCLINSQSSHPLSKLVELQDKVALLLKQWSFLGVTSTLPRGV